jgi:hypothetical protein
MSMCVRWPSPAQVTIRLTNSRPCEAASWLSGVFGFAQCAFERSLLATAIELSIGRLPHAPEATLLVSRQHFVFELVVSATLVIAGEVGDLLDPVQDIFEVIIC